MPAATITTIATRIQMVLRDTPDSPPKKLSLLAENDTPVQSVKRTPDQGLVGNGYFARAASSRSKKASNPAWAWPLITKVGVAETLYLATPSSPTLVMAASSALEAMQLLASA